MTKDGSFKRAARARARDTGQKYTEVRAEMDSAEPVWQWNSPAFQHDALKAHLQERYGVRVTSMAAFDVDHPATLWVERSDGRPWVARVFASTSQNRDGRPVRGLPHLALDDRIERLKGDAEILRWLESHGYPAERLAHPEPVTALDESGVIVTEYVPGARPDGSPQLRTRLGDLLGRLHALPRAGGAMSRDGGCFDHEPMQYGRPSEDIAAAMRFLRTVEGGVDPKRRDKFDWLVDQVANADDCEGLPEAFTHGNYGRSNTVETPGGDLVVVAWAASGRAPRLATLGWLLSNKFGQPRHIETIVRAYSKHVRVTDEELERLPGAVLMRGLYLAGWYYRASVASGYTPSGGEGWWPDPARAEWIASCARAAFREGTGRRSPTVTEATRDREEEHAVSEMYGKSSQSTVVDRYRRSADAFEALIAATPPDRWEQPSPCEKWLARDIVAHVVGLSGGTLRQRQVELTEAPSVRDDPAAAFRAIRSDVERVLADPTITSQSLNWLDAALSFDLPQHGWDLAKATGQDATMDPELLRAQWETASQMPPENWAWQRKSGHYGPEVPIPDDAPLQDRLLGLIGRDPDWTPTTAKKKTTSKPPPAKKKTAAKRTTGKKTTADKTAGKTR